MSKRENMVRYGRLEGSRTPKNTLTTFKRDGQIYFGIARCNNGAGDVFKRHLGTVIATNRAKLSLENDDANEDYTCNEGKVRLHSSGLRGVVSVEEVRALLTYFNSVDTFSKLAAVRNSRTALNDISR